MPAITCHTTITYTLILIFLPLVTPHMYGCILYQTTHLMNTYITYIHECEMVTLNLSHPSSSYTTLSTTVRNTVSFIQQIYRGTDFGDFLSGRRAKGGLWALQGGGWPDPWNLWRARRDRFTLGVVVGHQLAAGVCCMPQVFVVCSRFLLYAVGL